MFKGAQFSARISDIEIPDYDRTLKSVDIGRPDFEARLPL